MFKRHVCVTRGYWGHVGVCVYVVVFLKTQRKAFAELQRLKQAI